MNAQPAITSSRSTSSLAGPVASAASSGRLRYQSPESRQTLAEGLAELRASSPGLIDEDALNEDARELFHNHDVAHVVFGCNTELVDEGMVDAWTMFGSDVGLRRYLEYMKMDEAKQLLREIGLARAAWAMLAGAPRLIRAAWRARRMTKKWPWTEHAAYLDRPLADIRAEFGIRVVAA